MIERFKPLEAVRFTAYSIRLLGAEALAWIDRKLDWVPDDTLEEARIKSQIWSLPKGELPAETEEDLGQLTLWDERDTS